MVEDLFQNITLYENETKTATYERRDDGKYVVRLAVESLKFRADGMGVEEAIPIDDWIDIGVFGAAEEDGPPEGRLLALEKRHINDASGTLMAHRDDDDAVAAIEASAIALPVVQLHQFALSVLQIYRSD